MSVAFKKITAPMTLYDVRKGAGRGSYRQKWDTWLIRVLSVDHETGTALVSWNSNRPTTWTANDFARPNIRIKKPEQ
jgi:hypothetical protein